MASRAELNTLATSLGIDPSAIPNDSKLEQKIIWTLKNQSAAVSGVAATTTLTSTGVAGNNETMTIGTRVYTFKTTLTGAADEILIGAAATNTLDNIKDAINGTSVSGGPGTTYGTGTKRHPLVTAGTKTATTVVIAASDINIGGGTATPTTETMANFSFTGANLSAGTIGILADNTTGTKFTRDALSGGVNTSL